MIHSFDNPPFAPEPACPACGKPWTQHPPLIATCAELERYKALLREATDLLAKQIDFSIELQSKLAAHDKPPQTPT